MKRTSFRLLIEKTMRTTGHFGAHDPDHTPLSTVLALDIFISLGSSERRSHKKNHGLLPAHLSPPAGRGTLGWPLVFLLFRRPDRFNGCTRKDKFEASTLEGDDFPVQVYVEFERTSREQWETVGE